MRTVTIFLVAASCAASALAQTGEPFFPQPSYFKRHFATAPTKVELEAPVRLSDFVADGKLELSLKNYLDLVLANNPDVNIEKLSVEYQKNAIERAFSVFDPALLGRFNSTRTQSPSNSALVGAANLNELNQPFSLNYTQTLGTGMSYAVGYTDTKRSTNSTFATYNPSYGSSLNFNVTQPLLRGRGSYFTRMPITIARSRLKSSMYTLEDQLMQLVANSELAYWAVIEARENLRVQEQSLGYADTSLKRSKRELELGAISALEIYQPEANYANAQIAVTQARYRLQQAEDALRKQMGADLDASTRDLPIVLTESVTPPSETTAYDKDTKEGMVQEALNRRPDLKALAENLGADDLSIAQANNALLPDLSLTAQYGAYGQGGTFFGKQDVFLGDGTTSQVTTIVPGGFGNAFTQMFGFGYPTYGFGLTLRLPIKDHKAAADLADAVVTKKLDAFKIRSTQQTIRLQVLQAISQVENSKASVEMAKVARDLAQKRVEADQKRYDLGTTTLFFLLASQNDLATAESALVREMINYRRNLLNLLQRRGDLLQERGITVQ
jgi:outer membrane protein TolC